MKKKFALASAGLFLLFGFHSALAEVPSPFRPTEQCLAYLMDGKAIGKSCEVSVRIQLTDNDTQVSIEAIVSPRSIVTLDENQRYSYAQALTDWRRSQMAFVSYKIPVEDFLRRLQEEEFVIPGMVVVANKVYDVEVPLRIHRDPHTERVEVRMKSSFARLANGELKPSPGVMVGEPAGPDAEVVVQLQMDRIAGLDRVLSLASKPSRIN